MKTLQINNQTIQIPDDRYDELVKEFCGSKRWKPKDGEIYYLVNDCGHIIHREWGGCREDVEGYRYYTGNCFRTKKEAEAKLAYINALAEINEYIAENEGKYADSGDKIHFLWDNNQSRFRPSYWNSLDVLACALFVNSDELALDLIANQSHNLKVVAGVIK